MGERPDPVMTLTVSVLLLVGVVGSVAVMTIGLALLIATGETGYGQALTPALLRAPVGTVVFPTTPDGVLRGAVEWRPVAVIELGALLLIATPVLRVATSVLLFLAEQDWLYAGITAIVLAVLLISIIWLR
jgi:uncharacterized membrane protein